MSMSFKKKIQNCYHSKKKTVLHSLMIQNKCFCQQLTENQTQMILKIGKLYHFN